MATQSLLDADTALNDAARQWLITQPVWVAAETRFAEVAAARDLGYTYGTYATAGHSVTMPEAGFYARVRARNREGRWRLELDVLQPEE